MSNYIEKLPDDAKQIPDAYDFVDTKGNVYGIENRNNNKQKGRYFIKSQHKVHGYKYCGINYKDGTHRSTRVHRLVARTFIPNPNNLPVVMHINNKKDDNRVDNLRWGTVQENTQQAYDDGLMKNDCGFDDSQSFPVDCYDVLTNNFIASYGSCSEAELATGICKATIKRQAYGDPSPIRKKFYFVPYGNGPRKHTVILKIDFDTDEEICRYPNIGQASAMNNNIRIERKDCSKKPKWSKYPFYFKEIVI